MVVCIRLTVAGTTRCVDTFVASPSGRFADAACVHELVLGQPTTTLATDGGSPPTLTEVGAPWTGTIYETSAEGLCVARGLADGPYFETTSRVVPFEAFAPITLHTL